MAGAGAAPSGGAFSGVGDAWAPFDAGDAALGCCTLSDGDGACRPLVSEPMTSAKLAESSSCTERVKSRTSSSSRAERGTLTMSGDALQIHEPVQQGNHARCSRCHACDWTKEQCSAALNGKLVPASTGACSPGWSVNHRRSQCLRACSDCDDGEKDTSSPSCPRLGYAAARTDDHASQQTCSPSLPCGRSLSSHSAENALRMILSRAPKRCRMVAWLAACLAAFKMDHVASPSGTDAVQRRSDSS